MGGPEIDALLRQTLEDRRLSRGERRALTAVLTDADAGPEERALYRNRAFALAREALTGQETEAVLGWLEDVVKALVGPPAPATRLAEVLFSPGDAPRLRLVSLIGRARTSIDICVFTLTDDRLAAPLVEAHRRGVAVRIITDDDKSLDRGSDVVRLDHAGIDVRVDRTQAHMHHKFALFDRTTAVTGSYNWTRSAARDNEENLLVTDEPRIARAYGTAFDRMWASFG